MQTVIQSTHQFEALTRRVMRRVYWHWFWRRQAPALASQLGVLALVALGIHEFVSVRFVLHNAFQAISDIRLFANFLVVGFRNTGFVPQLLFGASFLLGLLLLRDFSRVISAFRAPQKLKATV